MRFGKGYFINLFVYGSCIEKAVWAPAGDKLVNTRRGRVSTSGALPVSSPHQPSAALGLSCRGHPHCAVLNPHQSNVKDTLIYS